MSLACTADAGLVAGAVVANRSTSSTVSTSPATRPREAPHSATALTKSDSAISTFASSRPRLCANTSPRWW
ncbi:Uncharacterised protein [Mycobacterium tuberculosis]|uniref:Uncharacterized protein n=1 Tax=Mycobacterium tuberculosis TaxID=1773 RepID=A0A0U0QS30_MYCTX|nr:Uncharacterised protein [Mycobacterium tuberculosis]COV28187.1 Uncharacterised protein [Mycobacterium tuberculosis]